MNDTRAAIRVDLQLIADMVPAGSRVLDDLCAELAAYHACGGLVSFEMFVLQKL